MTKASDPKNLDDGALLAELRALVAQSNLTEAELLAHLAEVDERRLYLPEHTSMFGFCTAELGFSECAAENRITVARAARRFPQILTLLGTGAIKRAVYERGGGQCTYVGPSGKRCTERGRLELDHVQGFARRAEHTVEALRLLCSSHNAHAADEMYGRAFMAARRAEATRPGATRRGPPRDPPASTALACGRNGEAAEGAGPADVPTGGGPPAAEPPLGSTGPARPQASAAVGAGRDGARG